MHLCNLLQRELAGKDKALKTHRTQKPCPIGSPYIALGRGKERNGRKILHSRNCHILHNKRICPYAVKPVDKCAHLLQLLLVQDGIDCHINTRIKGVRIAYKLLYLLQGVACGLPCAKRLGCNIYSIGTAAYCRNADISIFGWSQKLKLYLHNAAALALQKSAICLLAALDAAL